MIRPKKIAFLSMILLTIISFFYPADLLAKEPIPIKLAILDSANMPQKLSLWSEYQNSYISGITTAAQDAKKYGFHIQYKPFFYGTEPLDVLDQIPKVQAWQPDLILGPHYSNQFLLLRKYFPEIMVLSSYASDPDIEKLPKNFYSLCLPIASLAKAMNQFIHERFPEKNVLVMTQADCKECMNLSKLFISTHNKFLPTQKISDSKFLQDEVETLDVKSIIKNHENDVIVLIPPTYYIYNILINRIANTMPEKHFVFITDVDNWGNSKEGSLKGQHLFNFQSYRIVPATFSQYAPEFNNFIKSYYQLYHTRPSDAVSYMTYITVMSAVHAMQKFPNSTTVTRKKLLSSYLSALKKDPNWYRPENYTVYHLTPHGEILDEAIPLKKLN
jgi:hypothetical protein